MQAVLALVLTLHLHLTHSRPLTGTDRLQKLLTDHLQPSPPQPLPPLLPPAPARHPPFSLLCAVEPRSESSSIWSTFTLNASTLFLGPQLLGSTLTTSDAGCAELCGQAPGCTWFAWCPDWSFMP